MSDSAFYGVVLIVGFFVEFVVIILIGFVGIVDVFLVWFNFGFGCLYFFIRSLFFCWGFYGVLVA
ncbi:hypothetical protein, partial [Acinetobacter baumannii]